MGELVTRMVPIEIKFPPVMIGPGKPPEKTKIPHPGTIVCAYCFFKSDVYYTEDDYGCYWWAHCRWCGPFGTRASIVSQMLWPELPSRL